MSARFDRRALLAGLSGLAASTLLPRGVRAATPPPKRLVIVFSANGTIYDSWKPSGSGSSFTLSPILKPLAPYQSKLLVLDGIDVKSAQSGPGDDHMKGMGHMLTGTALLSGSTQGGAGTPAGFAGGISIDQRIVADIGKATRFPSLEFGVMVQNSDVWSRMIYAGANQPLPPMEDPQKAFQRIFGGANVGAAQAALLLKRRQSVLDYATSSLGSLTPHLSSADAARVAQHQDSIRQIETQLAGAGASCTTPSVGSPIDLNNVANYPTIAKLQTDLLVASLACDQTRVASLQFSHSVSDIPMPWLNIGTGHHTLSHDADSDATAQSQLVQINTWYAQQFAYLLGQMDAVKESNGTMLDNSVVVWINELAKGNIHSHSPLPVVLAGGAGGQLKTGRLLSFNDAPHNNLLVTLANLMGTSITTFGDPTFCTGPLSLA